MWNFLWTCFCEYFYSKRAVSTAAESCSNRLFHICRKMFLMGLGNRMNNFFSVGFSGRKNKFWIYFWRLIHRPLASRCSRSRRRRRGSHGQRRHTWTRLKRTDGPLCRSFCVETSFYSNFYTPKCWSIGPSRPHINTFFEKSGQITEIEKNIASQGSTIWLCHII